MLNPLVYCIKCDRRYGLTEESCSNCGFNPIDNGPDEEEQDRALIKFEEQENAHPR